MIVASVWSIEVVKLIGRDCKWLSKFYRIRAILCFHLSVTQKIMRLTRNLEMEHAAVNFALLEE